MFSDWQRELNRVPIRFSIPLIQLLYGLCTSFPCLSCDIMWCDAVTSCCVTVTMWHLWHNTFLHFLLCSKSKIKEKEKKINININNNLAVLPSHDTTFLLSFLVLRNFLQLIAWVYYVAYLVIIIFYSLFNSWIFFLDFFFLYNCFHLFFSWLLFFSLSPIPFQPSPIFLVVSFIWPSEQFSCHKSPWQFSFSKHSFLTFLSCYVFHVSSIFLFKLFNCFFCILQVLSSFPGIWFHCKSCKGTSRVTLSKFWGSDLLMAQQ